jgi:hypothetical protein
VGSEGSRECGEAGRVPASRKPSRHVGVGAVQGLLALGPDPPRRARAQAAGGAMGAAGRALDVRPTARRRVAPRSPGLIVCSIRCGPTLGVSAHLHVPNARFPEAQHSTRSNFTPSGL